MCGEEHAGHSICIERRPTLPRPHTDRLLDDLVVVRVRSLRSAGVQRRIRRPPSRCQFSAAARSGQPKLMSGMIARSTSDPLARREDGGARRDRTDDLMLAKHALSQLSYGPDQEKPARNRWLADSTLVGPGRFELPTPRLSSVCSNQLSYGPSPAALAQDRFAETGLAIPLPFPAHLQRRARQADERFKEEKRRRR